MGIFAMALYYIQQKIKEIGIRKINGAKVVEVMVMLNKDFLNWVVIAFIIAFPIAGFTMHKWLQNFAYRTELGGGYLHWPDYWLWCSLVDSKLAKLEGSNKESGGSITL